jgi:hypothetical protein
MAAAVTVNALTSGFTVRGVACWAAPGGREDAPRPDSGLGQGHPSQPNRLTPAITSPAANPAAREMRKKSRPLCTPWT